MDKPKCRTCGERHQPGPCPQKVSDYVSDRVFDGVRPVKPERKKKLAAKVKLAEPAVGDIKRFDRAAYMKEYMREYMRKRRAKK